MGEGGKRRGSAVPEGRAERLGRLGVMLAGMAGEAAREVLRRAAGRGEGGSVVLGERGAQRLADGLSELRGAAMKLGQMLSLHGEEWLSPELSRALARLRSQADLMPEAQVRAVLARELGPDWEARFAEFDFEPIAAASIGQVHAAEAADGRDLAIKVQYPGVARSISSDVDNLGALVRWLRLLPGELEIETLLPELKQALLREADYRREARATWRYAGLVSDDPGVVVPRVHADLSTRHVLATDRIRALPIEDLRSPEHPQARRDRIGTLLLRLVFRELFVFRFMQTDPNFANYLFEPKEERVALLDFGAARSFPRRFTEAYRSLVDAAIGGDRGGVLAAGERIGFVDGEDPRELRVLFEDLARLFAEPLRTSQPYDFGASDLARRARERSFDAARLRRLPRVPSDVLFLHRKLGGSFLLCAHIGARVDCRALYEASR
jgi:predicted unusual protein kinase regulating ubiquinone biosynthesis (AarF/ABC1/UbiB family)